MPEITPLDPMSPWVELRTTAQDWDEADPALLTDMLVQGHLLRAFEETALELAAAGLVHGPLHSSIGQEGAAVGSIITLRSTDGAAGTHRGHHQFLAKALTHVHPGRWSTEQIVDDDVEMVLRRTLAEVLGLSQGFCYGRGGSMHLQWREAGALGTNAIVGGGVPLAAGKAWSQHHLGTDDVTIAYFGDGASNIGSVLESLNLTAAWNTPLCFFIENNLYAVSTHIDEVSRERRLSARGLGFGIPAWQVDGQDALAVHLATQLALQQMRAGNGPTIIEAQTYRYLHQNGPFPGSAFGYRSKAEEAAWRDRDPLVRLATELSQRGHLQSDAPIREQARHVMAEIAGTMLEADPDGKPGSRRIVPALWPDPEDVNAGVRGDASELAKLPKAELASFSGSTSERKFIEAVSSVMARRMTNDDRIVVLGEDIQHLGGGTNGATKGLTEQFPDRVLGTPISENAFTGMGGGMALDGRILPVVELMYADFMWVAADQVFNQIGKARYMFGGEHGVPLVLRTKVAMGAGYGTQHSMDPAGLLATSPGWRVVAPSTPFDYIGLMNTALALQDPVVVLEHVDLYTSTGPVPDDDLDYCIPVGAAATVREGTEVTVLTYLSMVQHTLEAVDQTGVDAEVIDLRWLDRASMDWDTIATSVRKTNKVLIVEQGALGTSYGGWLADEVQRRLFDYLDAPIQRVHGSEASPTVSKVLERAAQARTPEVAAGLLRVQRMEV
ncbi:MAG: thiamine pyrophosphate-dependent enzyme [Beutenbergiaceae bacterium]